MFKTPRFFALFALFLGFYLSGIAINLINIINQDQHHGFVCSTLVKEQKSAGNEIPSQLFEPVDEREIDEDEQIRLCPYLFIASQILSYYNLSLSLEKKVALPYHYQQDFSIKAPRTILFHSWKLFTD